MSPAGDVPPRLLFVAPNLRKAVHELEVDAEAFHRWIYQLATRRCLSVLRTRSRRRTDATDADDLERDLPVDAAQQVRVM